MKFFTIFAFAAVVAFVSFGAEAQTTTSAASTTTSAALPTFTYNLLEKSIDDRQALCNQNMGYCLNNCGGTSKTPKNFCNATTMGWGCGCTDKVPDYQAYQWPVNYADCVGRGLACQKACNGNNDCVTACSNSYSSLCGTPKQPPAYYEVSDPSITPSYGPPTSSNNNSTVTTGSATVSGTSSPNSNSTTTTSNDANVLSYSMLYLLAIVAGGMTML